MQQRWVAFAHGAAPDADGSPAWARFQTGAVEGTRATLVIDAHDSLVTDLDAPIRAAWGDEVLTFR